MSMRSPVHRPWTRMTTVALSSAAAIAMVAAVSLRSSSAAPAERGLTFSNASGVHRTIALTGAIDTGNPFFQELGTNGRTCFSCHRPAEAWSITPEELSARFAATDGLDPVFRTNDGSNCEGADVSTLAARRQAFSLLLAKGLIRIALEVPQNAEFEVDDVDDPYHCGSVFSSIAAYRRPLPTTNLRFISAVMWDGRQTTPLGSIHDDLLEQTRDAVTTHAAGAPPSASQLRDIVEFELGLFTAQVRGNGSGTLTEPIARGGPEALSHQSFCLGINDPLQMLPAKRGACLKGSSGLDPVVFTLFNRWLDADSPERTSIARGERVFNTRTFVIANVAGLNGGPQDPVQGPIASGTCTICHDTPNAGNHSVAMALNIGLADAAQRTPDLPLYTLRHKVTGEVTQTTDPGRAMVTGKWADVGKFKGPVLRGLAARAPYFHNGAAATLDEALDFYEKRFQLGLSPEERADLIAFLKSL